MVHHVYSVSPRENGWAVEHIGKTLDIYPTQMEAERAADRLAKLTQASGHDAELIVDGKLGEVQSNDLYRRVER